MKLKIKFTCNTAGDGLWSRQKKAVKVVALELLEGYMDELRVHFDVASWDIDEDGLVYTDKGFLKNLRSTLSRFGFSKEELADFNYSEQGMQSENYISFDSGEKFSTAFKRLAGNIK